MTGVSKTKMVPYIPTKNNFKGAKLKFILAKFWSKNQEEKFYMYCDERKIGYLKNNLNMVDSVSLLKCLL